MKDFKYFILNPNGTLNTRLIKSAKYEFISFELDLIYNALKKQTHPKLTKTLIAYKKALLTEVNRRAELIPTHLIASIYNLKISNNYLTV